MEHIVFLNSPEHHTIELATALEVGEGGSLPEIWIADGALTQGTLNQYPHSAVHWFGDCDSMNSASKALLTEEIKKNSARFKAKILSSDKNLSDGAAIFDALMQREISAARKIQGSRAENPLVVRVFGGLGGRRDHEWANIFEAVQFVKNCPRSALVIFTGMQDSCVVSNGSFTLKLPVGHVFTVLDAQAGVDSSRNTPRIEIFGACYSGPVAFERPSHGLSNKSVSSKVEIKQIFEDKLQCILVFY